MKYEKFKIGGYRVVSADFLASAGFSQLFNSAERIIVSDLLQIQNWQIGEGPLPEGYTEKTASGLMSSESVRLLAVRCNAWYERNGGKYPAICGPFGVKIEKGKKHGKTIGQ